VTILKSHLVFFPFDLFGHPGTRTGCELLCDAVREMLRDNRREKTPTRARAYAGKVKVEEFLFEKLGDYRDWRKQAADVIAPILASRDFFLWSTGNHLGAMPVYEVLLRDHPNAVVIQFDAHLDIYDLTDSTTELSHGNFLRHLGRKPPRIVNLGHREQVLHPDAIAEFFTATFSAGELHHDPTKAFAALDELTRTAETVIVDIDCDVFDPAYFPGVAQPEPFGLSPAFVLGCLQRLPWERVRGVVVSEFFPAHDERDRSLATLLWLVEWMLLRNHER
jgi:arginase family enzyme